LVVAVIKWVYLNRAEWRVRGERIAIQECVLGDELCGPDTA
jgi:hypothetical protein